MRSRSVLAAALLLAGCGPDPTCPPPGIQVKYQTVTKEVQQPCAAKLPDAPKKLSGPVPNDANAAVPILLAKLAEFFGNPDTGKPGYVAEAERQMAICQEAGK